MAVCLGPIYVTEDLKTVNKFLMLLMVRMLKAGSAMNEVTLCS